MCNSGLCGVFSNQNPIPLTWDIFYLCAYLLQYRPVTHLAYTPKQKTQPRIILITFVYGNGLIFIKAMSQFNQHISESDFILLS